MGNKTNSIPTPELHIHFPPLRHHSESGIHCPLNLTYEHPRAPETDMPSDFFSPQPAPRMVPVEGTIELFPGYKLTIKGMGWWVGVKMRFGSVGTDSVFIIVTHPSILEDTEKAEALRQKITGEIVTEYPYELFELGFYELVLADYKYSVKEEEAGVYSRTLVFNTSARYVTSLTYRQAIRPYQPGQPNGYDRALEYKDQVMIVGDDASLEDRIEANAWMAEILDVLRTTARRQDIAEEAAEAENGIL